MAPLAMAQIAESITSNQNSYRRVGEQIERSTIHAISTGVIGSSGALAVCASTGKFLPRSAMITVPIAVGTAIALTVYNSLVQNILDGKNKAKK